MYQFNPLLEMSIERYKKALQNTKKILKNQGKSNNEINKILTNRLEKGKQLSRSRISDIAERVIKLRGKPEAKKVAMGVSNGADNLHIRSVARAFV